MLKRPWTSVIPESSARGKKRAAKRKPDLLVDMRACLE
jgi:hypothetical protein